MKYSLSKREIIKGLVLAAISSTLFFIQDCLDSGSLHFDGKKIAIAAISGAIAYLLKTFFEGQTPQKSGE